MKVVALKSGKYEGTYKLAGGELSLDFVNTISYPGGPKPHDWFNPKENFVIWAEVAGLQVSKEIRELKDEQLELQMVQILQIRKILTCVLKPLVFGELLSADTFQQLNTLLQQASTYRYINQSNHQWTWRTAKSLFELAAPIIWNAAYIITELDHSRLGYCKGCDWLFYDTTRNHSRKWCDMEDCGSRDKALRYYHRTKNG